MELKFSLDEQTLQKLQELILFFLNLEKINQSKKIYIP